MPNDTNFDEIIRERFKILPEVVQNAIVSADVQKRLRALADTHKLHIDQWQSLENEVMLTLLGIHPIEELEQNIENDLEIAREIAHQLAENINIIIFEPIREELERQLEYPDAQAASESGVEAARTQMLGDAQGSTPTQPSQPTVAPATPPAPQPQVNIARAPSSGAYKPGEPSTKRKSVVDDPYRESPQ